MSRDLTAPLTAETQAALTPAAVLQLMKDGNRRFLAAEPVERDFLAQVRATAAGQYPMAAILGCIDSRVPHEIIFDKGVGDVFSARVAGNFVDTNGLASMEFGVAVLNIPLLMVLGHTGCGAISATIDVIENGTELPGHLPSLVDGLKPGVEKALATKPADPMEAATAENVRYNVEKLKAATPIVAEAVAAGKVKIVGGVYNIATGKVELV